MQDSTSIECAYEHCSVNLAAEDFHAYCLNHRACFNNGQLIPCQSCNITFSTLLDSHEPIHPICNVWHNLIKKYKKRRLRAFGDENIWRNDDDERDFTLPCEVCIMLLFFYQHRQNRIKLYMYSMFSNSSKGCGE